MPIKNCGGDKIQKIRSAKCFNYDELFFHVISYIREKLYIRGMNLVLLLQKPSLISYKLPRIVSSFLPIRIAFAEPISASFNFTLFLPELGSVAIYVEVYFWRIRKTERRSYSLQNNRCIC